MKKFYYSFGIILSVLTLISCGNDKKGDQAQMQQQGPTQVVTIKVPTRDVTTYKDYPTSIEGIINSDARPKIAGYITDVLVDEGQKVRQGQILFRLETASLTEDADAAQANINAAQVQVDQLKPLVEKKIVSQNQLATAEAQLSQAKANLKSIQANIGYATVKSPVDGYVGSIRIRKGNLVSPSDPKPLTTVTDISKVYAYFSMNEKDYLNFLKTAKGETKQDKIENMPEITLTMANGDEYPHKGKIQTINSQIGKGSGSVSFRAVFDNPELLLTNGSTGRISIPTLNEGAPIVPQKSTFERQGRTYVGKIVNTDEGTIADLQSIEVKDKVKGLYIVESGIEEGDEIIGEGVDKIQSGTPVVAHEQPFDSIAKPLKAVFR